MRVKDIHTDTHTRRLPYASGLHPPKHNYQLQQSCLPFKISETGAMFTLQIISDSSHVYHSNQSVTAAMLTTSDSNHVYHSNHQWQQPCLLLVTAAKFSTKIKSTNMLMPQWCLSSTLQGLQHTVCITMHMTATTHVHASGRATSSSFVYQ